MNGLLVASSGALLSQSAPLHALAGAASGGLCDDVDGGDARFARGGNLPSAFNVGHWMRDQRLSFEPGTVNLTAGCDDREGKFPIAEDGGDFDVIIVGTGLAGLSAAFHLLKQRPATRIMMLEANNYAGGNAGRDQGEGLPVPASTAGALCAFPYDDSLTQFYRELGIDWNK